MHMLQRSMKAALCAGLMVEEKLQKTGVRPDAILSILPVGTLLGIKILPEQCLSTISKTELA